MLSPQAGGDGTVIKLGEVVMILDLHRQGRSVSAIALQLGIDRKTVRKYLARGLEAPVYGPRQPRPAFAALGGVPRQILYDRMKTAVTGEDAVGHIVYNRALVDFARHHGFHPRPAGPTGPRPRMRLNSPFLLARGIFCVLTGDRAAKSRV